MLMARFEMTGGRKLYGDIVVQGSKNAVLPIMAASILTEKTVVLNGCPLISDVENLKEIMEELGVVISREGHTLTIYPEKLRNYAVLGNKVGSLRSSILLLGPLLGRMNKVLFSMPGGCAIGKRPIDLHIRAVENLNCKTSFCEGVYYCHTANLKGGEIELGYPSVGATENAVMAAVLATGSTVIKGAAKEPEITVLCEFLNVLGAKISGAGTSEITIDGVISLNGGTFTIPSDRIAAGTCLCAAALTGGELNLKMSCHSQLDETVRVLRNMGAAIKEEAGGFCLGSDGRLISPGELVTEPYPGFPTDMQSIFLPLLSVAEGECRIEETVFENRYGTVRELEKMGACMTREGRYLMIKGGMKLHAADVHAPDLRGGAALILAGLKADGRSRVLSGENIVRGYEDIAGSFSKVGADIKYFP